MKERGEMEELEERWRDEVGGGEVLGEKHLTLNLNLFKIPP